MCECECQIQDNELLTVILKKSDVLVLPPPPPSMNGYLICLANPFVYVWKPLTVVIHWNVHQWCCSVNFASHFGFCVRFVCAVTSTARPYRNFVILIFISLSIFQCNTHTHAHAAFQRIVIHLSLSGASSPLNLFACVCTCVCVRVCAYVSFALIFGSIGA